MKLKRFQIFYIFLIFGAFFTLVSQVYGATGYIDTSATNQAKVCHDSSCTSFGIINFELQQQASIVIEDNAGITGKVWGNELGWITMNPTGGGVIFSNAQAGTLSGKAWSQVSGWINFAPTGQGVTINPDTGEFNGWAWSGGAHGGWIKFDCTDASSCVKTTWRPDGDDSTTGSQCTKNCGGPPACEYPFTMIDGECVCEPPLVQIGGWCAYDDTFPDICPNIPELQTVLPDGMHLEGGQCVFNATDICPNIAGNQGTVPSGMQILGGQCVNSPNGGGSGSDPGDNPPSDPSVPNNPPSSPPPGTDTPPGDNGSGNGGSSGFIPDIMEGVISDIQVFFAESLDKLSFLIETPTGKLISRIFTTLGVVTGAIAFFGLADLGLNLLRLWSLFLYGMGFKKRNRPWGVVYDSVTKQPLDPAYVVLYDMAGKEIATSITDLDGRYGFLVDPGFYTIVAQKTNYTYPSRKLAGRTNDELYNDLYFGEQIEVKEEGEVITKNIPLDQIGFDWNEFAKKEQNRMKFYHSRDQTIGRLSDIIFILGFVVSVIVLFVVPGPYNLIIFSLYALLFFLRRMKIGRNKKGNVSFELTNVPLSYGILRVKTQNGQEIAHRVLDRFGNYYCLIPNGYYTITLEKKSEDGTYTSVFTSSPIEVKGGILKRNFKI